MGFRSLHDRARVPFTIHSPFEPCGDQPAAIEKLTTGLDAGLSFQTLLGITGSGKTFTIANVIAHQNRPTLVVAPNKTLAAQLYGEFKEFFPENRVKFFVSYYDYYQPEAYVPSTDTFIEKDSAINEEIDKLRHGATKALLEGTDTIIVASVSCIYGLGAPEEYLNMMFLAEEKDVLPRKELLKKLVEMQYTRSEYEFTRGNFRVRGETIDIFPSDQDKSAVRLLFFGDEIEEIWEIEPITGRKVSRIGRCAVYPVSHFVTGKDSVERAIRTIQAELGVRLSELQAAGKIMEAERLEQRTLYDMELMREAGFCPGIENYSRHIGGRAPGSTPTTLIDYFPEDFLLVIDESHVTVPQIRGMFRGDRSRKSTLVDYGFRLPSALDNRPLTFEEFWSKAGQAIFVSATPGPLELEWSAGEVVEQVIRPTGLLDPEVEVRPATHQVDDLIEEIRKVIEQGDRILVTTLTKKMAEDLAGYLREVGIRCRYIHADINTIERTEILRGLRRGDFDVLIGINLLREGLDLVEVSLVAILDADKEGFLRSTRSLIQTMGRAARNLRGRALLYGDKITKSMQEAIDEVDRRREIQARYNVVNNITPRSAQREIQGPLAPQEVTAEPAIAAVIPGLTYELPRTQDEAGKLLLQLREKMRGYAVKQEFEEAAKVRDVIRTIEKQALSL